MDMYSYSPSLKKVVFAVITDYWRIPQLVKMQRITDTRESSPNWYIIFILWQAFILQNDFNDLCSIKIW